eukprot:scaffold17361_cov30-Phaeocystis_antarctica.AAC.1
MVKVPLRQGPSSPLAPPQGAPGGNGWLDTLPGRAQATGCPATALGARAELVASKTTCSTCTLYLISRYVVFAHATMKALCLLAVGVIIGTAISLFFRSRRAQSKARGEEGDGLVNGQEKSDGGLAGLGEKGPAKPSWWDR